jgi:hypothetical protein
MKTLKQSELEALVESGAVSSVSIEPLKDNWILVIRLGLVERLYVNAKNEAREFPNLNTLAKFLQKMGISGASLKLF